MSDTLTLATELVSRATVTPVDAGCQQMLAERLERSGFKATHLRYEDVNNLWITHGE
ncbi:MAG: succinyl-diaminopimelate desuccinylase, partial [Gammaproteobacteria bacterium]